MPLLDAGWLEDGLACDAGSVCSQGECVVFSPAPHDALPQFTNGGGGLLTSFRLVTVTWSGYPYRPQVEALGDWIVTSPWLSAFAPAYGPLSATNQNVELANAAPAGTLATSDLEALLAAGIDAGTLPGDLTAAGVNNHLYLFFTPAATTVSFLGNLTCQGNLGFHFTNRPGSPFGPGSIAYAVIPDCDGGLPAIERTASHELIEAVTDPGISSFQINQGPWSEAGAQIEIGDTCEDAMVSIGGHTLSTAWSNAAASAGLDPCIPWSQAQGAYRNVSAQPPSQTVAAGQPATFVLTGWSNAPAADWPLTFHRDLAVFDFTPAISGGGAATINNGQTLTVQLTPPTGTPSGARAIVWVQSGTPPAVGGLAPPPTPFQSDEWPLTVQVQ